MIMLPIICKKPTGVVTSVKSVMHYERDKIRSCHVRNALRTWQNHYGRDTKISTNWSINPIKTFQTANTAADFWSMSKALSSHKSFMGIVGKKFH